MATPVDYKYYWIVFHDRNEYEFAVLFAGGTPDTGGILFVSPVTAAGIFGIPIPFPSGNLDLIDPAIVNSDTDGTTSVTLNNGGGTVLLQPNDDDGVILPGHPGTAGAATGVARIVQWAGLILYMQGQAPQDPLLPTAIPQRRWCGGFEGAALIEGGSGVTVGAGSRDASRTIDGIGFPIRAANTPGDLWTRTLNEYSAGFTTRKSYERVYFRPRVVGNGPVGFWRCRNSVSPAAGAGLVYNTSGGIDLYQISNTAAVTLAMSGYVPDNFKWVKLDIILQYPASGLEDGRIIIFANGVQIYDFTDSSGNNMDSVGFHAQSDIGEGIGIGSLGASDTKVEFDLDDWINAEWPLNAGVLRFDSMDFLVGSHVRRAFNISGTAASYTPANAFNITNQGNNPTTQLNSGLTSTTASAAIQLANDLPALGVQDKVGEVALGAVAAIIGINSTNASGTNGQLGYSVAGGADVMASVDETAAAKMNSVRYAPSGLIVPTEITPFGLRYTKSADAASAVVQAIQASVEYIGIWGREDCTDPDLFPDDIPRTNHLHNCQYPKTDYGFIGPTQDTMIYSVGGTYVGNGTQQDITLPDACHMLFIRGSGVGTNGVKWFGCSLGGHLGTTERVVPNFPVRVWFDNTTGLFKFTVSGTNVDINQNASTYQYIAFCDPGMRVCSGGCYNTPNNQTSRNVTLQNPGLLPEFAFFQVDLLGSASNSQGLRVKGPGNTGTIGNVLNGGGALANFGSFSTGVITTRVDNHPAIASQVNYLAFRSAEPGCGWVSIQCLSYTGDGAGSKVIPLTPVSGRFPLFVLVVPTSGAQAAIFRDPTHSGTNSARFDSLGNTTTGIIAGAIDQITVGASLNANGVIYNVFCIPGSDISWTNGTFFPPNCDSPLPWYNPPLVPPDIAVFAEGGLTLDGTTPLTLLRDVSGIYTLVPGKTNDTLYDRQSGQASVDVKIPDPNAKTGYLGG